MAESQSNHRESGTARYRRLKNTPEWAAKFAWNRITTRVGHHPNYAGVEIRMTKEEFLAWAIPAFEQWFREKPGVTPSIDRINSSGHYELGNVQILAYRRNCAKTSRAVNTELLPNHKQCGRCKQVLPFSSFKPVKPGNTGTFGLYGWCIECSRAYERERQKRRRR